MISKQKIAANRSNALKSTGPKSLNGKLRASRNAFRHGLATGIHNSPEFELKVSTAALELSNLFGHESIRESERAAAEAANELAKMKIRKLRAAALQSESIEIQEIDDLIASVRKLERYERRALSRRKKALQ